MKRKKQDRTGLIAFGVVFGGALLLVGVAVVVGSSGKIDKLGGGSVEKVTAEEMATVHESNPATSAKRWDGARVEVSGTVDDISRKEGPYWLFFQVSTMTKGPAVEFTSADALAKVKPGDKVKVRGRGTILDSGQLTITDPTIVPTIVR